MKKMGILLSCALFAYACSSSVAAWPSATRSAFTQPLTSAPTVLSVTANGTVDVSVEVESVTETIGGKAVTSGVYDLRLFRDGQLVGSSIPQKALEDYIKAAPDAVERDIKAGKIIDTEEDKLWRGANDLFAIVSPDFKKISATKGVYTFRNIQLPRDGRKEVEFSAYAFNSDRVKSDTTRTKYAIPEMPLAAIPSRKAYIVSVGVNRSDAGGDWALSCAVSDAQVTQKALADRLKDTYDVVPVELTSSAETATSPATRNAIKANVRAVLERLSGVTPGKADLDSLEKAIGRPLLDKILRSTPQDMVVVTFSSHGVAHASGDFYLLPSDIRMTKGSRIPDYDSMISSDELSLWMRDLDAADIAMIVDACHAAASVETPGFKPAPMGSRGLGQLAYDKQMRILTATRAKDIAVELKAGSQGVCQGLLTYALVQDGFVLGMADTNKPKPDGKIMFGEWLEFGRDDVPVVFKKWKSGDLPAAKGFKDKENPDPAGFTQQPALFDFRRDKSRDVQIH